MNLDDLSIEQIEEYLENRRKKDNHRPKPKEIFENSMVRIENLTPLLDVTESIIDDFVKYGYSKDCKEYVYETVFTVMYGQEYWEFINNI